MLVRNVRHEEVRKIHEKSLYLLENVGIRFGSGDVLRLFQEHGIRVEGTTAFFPPQIVEKARESFRPSFEIETPYTRVKIGESAPVLSCLSGARNILKDGKIRPSSLQDYLEGRILESTSDVIDISDPLFIQIAGLPKDRDPLIKTALTLRYSQKPVIAYCDTEKNASETLSFIRDFYRAPEDTFYCMGVGNMISPLCYSGDDVESILTFTKYNQPICITCCSMPGMTSPITIGGTIVQNNAEVLAGLVMTQLVKPGSPVIYGNLSFSSNMRRAVPVSWGPEVAVFMQYAKAMADFYHVPCRTGGTLSASREVDWQDGAETAMALMTAFDCNVDFVLHGSGGLDGLNTFSSEKFVLDEELIRSRRSLQNRDIFSDENIALESIEEVGPGGNYLLEEDTLSLYRTELFYSDVYNMELPEPGGRQDMPAILEKARRAVEKRIASFRPPVYEEWQEAMLREVLEGII